MELEKLARELGKAIQKDERYLKLSKCIEANEKDEALNEQMAKIQLLQMTYQKEAQGNPDPEKMQELEKEFNALYNEVMQNENMKNYEAARAEIDEMMNYLVEILALCHRDCAVSTVVNNLAGALACALFAVVNTHSFATANDFRRVYAKLTQTVYRCLSDFVRGKFSHESSVNAVVSKRYRYVCLRSAKSSLVLLALNETQIVFRCKAQHKFAKSNNFFHFFLQQVL